MENPWRHAYHTLWAVITQIAADPAPIQQRLRSVYSPPLMLLKSDRIPEQVRSDYEAFMFTISSDKVLEIEDDKAADLVRSLAHIHDVVRAVARNWDDDHRT